VLRETAVGAFANPDDEAPLLGDSGEVKVEPSAGKRQLLAARFPTKLVDKESLKITGLKQWTGAREI